MDGKNIAITVQVERIIRESGRRKGISLKWNMSENRGEEQSSVLSRIFKALHYQSHGATFLPRRYWCDKHFFPLIKGGQSLLQSKSAHKPTRDF